MRKSHWTIAALAAVTVAFAACEQQAAEEEGAVEEEMETTAADAEAELENLRSGYEQAWNNRDWDAILGFHTDDYQEITAEGETMGYADIEAAMRDTANAPPADATLSIDTETMEIAESGDLAYATGTSTMTATGPDGQPMTQRERWMVGFEKVDGEWKVDRLVLAPMGDGEAMETGAETAPGEEMAPAEEGETGTEM